MDQVTTYSFRLYTAGRSTRSQAAEANLRMLCATRLAGDYQLEVIDIVECPELVAKEHVIATPTVVRLTPSPQLRVIGDLSELDRAAAFLGFPEFAGPPGEERDPAEYS